MKPLYSTIDFEKSKSTDKLPLKCYHCDNIFYKYKKYIKFELKKQLGEVKFCSKQCSKDYYKKTQSIFCSNCNVEFDKKLSEITKSKSGNHFCSQSCSATFNNKNKTHGNRRSKLEIWLEEQLTTLYPNLKIEFNQKNTIGSELDIFIPVLNIAFELNGIFHYEPIYGVDKLKQIQENDKSKTKLCHDLKIDLCIIDVSQQKYVKPSTSQKYLDIIINIINERNQLVRVTGLEPAFSISQI